MYFVEGADFQGWLHTGLGVIWVPARQLTASSLPHRGRAAMTRQLQDAVMPAGRSLLGSYSNG